MALTVGPFLEDRTSSGFNLSNVTYVQGRRPFARLEGVSVFSYPDGDL